MDLQMVLFSDKDYFSVMNALTTKEGFHSFADRYNPDFVIVRRDNQKLKEFIKSFPEYQVIFFDNSAVLYVNENNYPRIAEGYELKKVDPYGMIDEDIDALDEAQLDPQFNELQRMYSIYPEDMIINLQIGRIYNKRNETEKALTNADIIIKNFPEFSHGYTLKGDIYKNIGLFEKSISFYKKALDCPFKTDEYLIFRRMALAYNKAGDDKNAYRTMKKAVQIFSPDAEYKDLWQLGNMAMKIGKAEEAMELFNYAFIKTPAEDIEFLNRVNNQINQLKPYLEEGK